MDEIPINNIRFEEITVKEVPTSEFKAVGRENKLLRDAYMDVKDGADTKYYVKHAIIENKLAKNLTIKPKQKIFGKTVSKIQPACIEDQYPCSIEKRMRLSKYRKSSVESPIRGEEMLELGSDD